MSAPLKMWVWFGAYLNFAGWFLSAIRQLNGLGYVAALLVLVVVVWCFRDCFWMPFEQPILFRKLYRRFRRPLPAIFLVVAGGAFLGGVLYAPNNYDAVTYRLPRILNWLAAGQWCWIPTINDRMNYSAPGWEWLAAPQLAILHSDRTLFLINVVSFLLLPGLLFSVFRQVGVARRVAWTWMWLLPLAYGYATQAGSLGNDLTGTVLVLASVHFGLRARRSGLVSDVWLAGLAAALLTGIKVSNLPLVLPCLVAVWPALPLLKQRWLVSAAVAGLAVIISALPIMGLNQWYSGHWSGDPRNLSQIQVNHPLGALFGNSLQLLQQTFMPPVLPAAQELYRQLNDALPASWHELLHQEFPRYYLGQFSELPGEESAGLGFGVSITFLILVVAAFARFGRADEGRPRFKKLMGTAVGLAAGIAFLFYLMKMGSEATARLLLPYYPLALLPFFKLSAQNYFLRFRWWKIWLLLVALSVLPPVILSPSRPLWPAVPVSRFWLQQHPDSHLAQRLVAVYAGYANRNDPLASLREQLPATARKVGLVIGSNDTEYSLWRPFGTRVVVCLRRDRTGPGLLLPDDVEWLVVRQAIWSEVSDVPLETWAVQHHARIVATVPIVTIVKRGPEDWCLLHLEK